MKDSCVLDLLEINGIGGITFHIAGRVRMRTATCGVSLNMWYHNGYNDDWKLSHLC